jgi:hypothetical protein
MHPPSQFLLDLRELCPHAITPGSSATRIHIQSSFCSSYPTLIRGRYQAAKGPQRCFSPPAKLRIIGKPQASSSPICGESEQGIAAAHGNDGIGPPLFVSDDV